MAIQSYRDLIVWQSSMDSAAATYSLTDSFPSRENFGLVAQMRRCAVSIPSNIAEGQSRGMTKDYLRHLAIAQGSRAELETQLLLAERLGYCDRSRTTDLLNRLESIGKMLRSLQRSLKDKL